jgi:hypothetical protein
MSLLRLKIDQVKDPEVREALQILKDTLNSIPILRGEFQHFSFEFAQSISDYRVRHNLGFTPKDVIQTFLTGQGSVTWHYDDFDSDFIYLSATGPCTVRALIGAYKEQSSA